MNFLLLGIFIFFGIHLIPSFVGFKRRIMTSLGEGRYKGLYSVIALTGLILIIYGKSVAEFQPVWEPPVWSKNVVVMVMVISFYLFAAADMKSNIKRFTRHPMLWGVALWSGAHLFANGDLASILLFGSFAGFSLLAMYSANRRGESKQNTKYPLTKDAISALAGLAAYGIFIIFLHPYLIGVSII